ncbi:MAG: endo alpha-1,4 polygalactosaminidase [Butyrivibrio sp.]|nr:endo alpha-1,4 polygalactosaminidase [Butyrivibrio sp.]
MNKRLEKCVSILLVLCMLLSCFVIETEAARKGFKYEYGVFLSVNAGKKAMSRFKDYKVLIIDAQNDFKAKDIKKLKKQGHVVYSYINVGAVENYRDYYNDYKELMLDVYENWPDERWVNVSDKRWQEFILDDLSERILKTGVDGFFVDNIDVYYKYMNTNHGEGIYEGLNTILKGLCDKGKVIVNGGDAFVRRYYEENGNLNGILDGVNQESVFSRIIDYKKDKFGKSKADDRKYFLDYLGIVKKAKKKVYILEYTKSKKLMKSIKKYCKKKGYKYYISKKLDLS